MKSIRKNLLLSGLLLASTGAAAQNPIGNLLGDAPGQVLASLVINEQVFDVMSLFAGEPVPVVGPFLSSDFANAAVLGGLPFNEVLLGDSTAAFFPVLGGAFDLLVLGELISVPLQFIN